MACLKAWYSSGDVRLLTTQMESYIWPVMGGMLGICGSALTIVSGRGMSSWEKYGCPVHVERGACSNGMRLRRIDIEREVLGGLQREVSESHCCEGRVG